MAQTINTLNECVDLVERFGKCLLNEKETGDLKHLGSYILHFSDMIENIKAREKIYEKFCKNIESSTEQVDWNKVKKQFDEEINNVKQSKNPEKCQKYVEFMTLISQNLSENDDDDDDDGDDDIATVSEHLNMLDPISKKPIVNPVRNKKCGHIYEKKTIYQFIKMNPKTKCPIPGCCESNFVKKSDLVEDHTAKKMLSKTSTEDNTHERIKIDD